VPWFAVEQPNMMPKPDLVPLTGGYRRIPVLQIGADVYCDSQLIVRVLERLHPRPTMYPDGSEGTCHAWNLWADRQLFLPIVAVVFADIGHLVPAAFMEDRSKMMPGRDFSEIPRQAPAAREQVRALVATLEAQLGDGRPFLSAPRSASPMRPHTTRSGSCASLPAPPRCSRPFPHVRGWMERVDAIGNGDLHPLEPSEALAIARTATPRPGSVAAGEPNALVAGDAVTVTPDDYGFDPVAGAVVAASEHEIAIRRPTPIWASS
jgi:glutathione S-transferase